MSLRKGGGSFDIDFPHGHFAEAEMERRLGGHRMEVKREDNALRHRGLYIETQHDPGARGNYVPSGLSISPDEDWGFLIGGLIIAVPTEWLRRQEPLCKRSAQPEGSCPTKGFVLPLWRITAEESWQINKVRPPLGQVKPTGTKQGVLL